MSGNSELGGTTGPRLRAWRGESWLGEWALDSRRALVFGRSRDCDVVVDDPLVSRTHFEVGPVTGGFEVVDLGSQAGTYCNGERISRRLLRTGDQLSVGETGFLALDVEPVVPAPLARVPPPPPAVSSSPVGQSPPLSPRAPTSQSAAPRLRRRSSKTRIAFALVALGIAALAIGGWLLLPRLREASTWLRSPGGAVGEDDDPFTLPSGFSDQAVAMGPAGGVIDRGVARLEVPAGALVREQKVEFVASGPVAAFTYTPAGAGYTLRSGQATFARPLRVTLPIDRTQLPAGTTADDIHVVIAHRGLGERLEGARVDLVAGTVTVELAHGSPLVFAQGSPGPATPPVLQAALGPAPGVLLTTRDVVYRAEAGVRDARALVDDVQPLLRLVRGLYAEMEFDPKPLLITFGKMHSAIGAYVSGGYSITINADSWRSRPDRAGTLVHEYFHLLQNRWVLRHLTRLGTLVPPDYAARGQGEWLWEATATWMEMHLIPGEMTASRNRPRLTRGFSYRPLNHFEASSTDPNAVNPDNPHQYAAFAFFSDLDRMYVGRRVVLDVWQDYLSGSWTNFPEGPTGENLELDAYRGFASFNPLEVLDRVLRKTPDNWGERHGLREVFEAFLLDYNWYKNFEPIANEAHSKELGPTLELVLPGRVVPWTLPFVANGKLELRRQHRASGGPFGIVAAYHITNQLDRTIGQSGDLIVRLEPPRNAPPEHSRLMVFPYRRGTEPPIAGSAIEPVKIENWQDYIGAVVWSVDMSFKGPVSYGVSAEVKPPAPRDPALPSFELVVTKAPKSNEARDISTYLYIELRFAELPGDAAELKTDAGAKRVGERRARWKEAVRKELAAGRRWVHVTVTIGGRVTHLYGDLDRLVGHKSIDFSRPINLPRTLGDFTAEVEAAALGQKLRQTVPVEVRFPYVEDYDAAREERDRQLRRIEVAPNDWSAYLTLATVLVRLRQDQEADEAFQKAIEWMVPGFGESREERIADIQALRADLALERGDVDKYLELIRLAGREPELDVVAQMLVAEKNDCGRALKVMREAHNPPFTKAYLEEIMPCPRPREGVTK